MDLNSLIRARFVEMMTEKTIRWCVSTVTSKSHTSTVADSLRCQKLNGIADGAPENLNSFKKKMMPVVDCFGKAKLQSLTKTRRRNENKRPVQRVMTLRCPKIGSLKL
jgi:hypothetical protein